MKYRIGMWAIAGLFVVLCWTLYILVTAPVPINAGQPIVWTLVRFTCPIVLARQYPLSIYWVLLANAATYALVGLIVESLRRQLRHAK